jgi:hypothetical protein
MGLARKLEQPPRRQSLDIFERVIWQTDSQRATFTGTIGPIFQTAPEPNAGSTSLMISIGLKEKNKRRAAGQPWSIALIRR